MRNCIKADTLRVQRKKSYIIMTSIILLLFIVACIVSRASGSKGPERFELIINGVMNFSSLLLGIPVFSAVLGDDFRSKSMQTAIGRGLSREKLILARLFEIVIIVVEAYIIFYLGILILGLIGGVPMSQIGDLIVNISKGIFVIIGFTSVSMIFVYLTQNGTLGLVFYILLGANVFDLLITLSSLLPGLRNTDINIGDYAISGMVGNAFYASSFGKGLIWMIAFLVCWVALPTFIAIQIFKKKELDF
ncbi:MAG: hypothetical protein K6F55_09200 [Eubacterium sp.]|nr:hypothetical protein [Eubacterium sp.]